MSNKSSVVHIWTSILCVIIKKNQQSSGTVTYSSNIQCGAIVDLQFELNQDQ